MLQRFFHFCSQCACFVKPFTENEIQWRLWAMVSLTVQKWIGMWRPYLWHGVVLPSFFNKVCPIQLSESARPFYTENNLIWSLYILEEGPGLNRRAADWRLHDGCSFNRTSTTAKAEKKRALFTALQLAALLLYIVLESLNYGRWMLRICCTLFCIVLCSKAFFCETQNGYQFWYWYRSMTCSRRLYLTLLRWIICLKYHFICSAFHKIEILFTYYYVNVLLYRNSFSTRQNKIIWYFVFNKRYFA